MAEFDFSRYAIQGATRPDSFSNMTPGMQRGLAAMLEAADRELGGGLQVYSGYRSTELQDRLFQDAVAKYGSEAAARKWVAPPGRSRHNTGQAADLKFRGVRIDKAPEDVKAWIRDNAGKYGLSVPMEWEPWQVEEAGARSGQTSARPVSGGEVSAEGGQATAEGGEGDDTFNINDMLAEAQRRRYAQPSVTDAYVSAGSLDPQSLLIEAQNRRAMADPLQPRITEAAEAEADASGRFTPDIAGEMAQPLLDTGSAALASLTGSGPSMGREMIPESIPIWAEGGAEIRIPEGLRSTLGPVIDAGIAALSGAGSIPAGAAGLVGDVGEALGMSPQSARRLSRDLSAVPEAFAGSSQQIVPRAGGQSAGRNVPAITAGTPQRMEPTITPPRPRPQTPEPITAEEIGELARKAASGGMGSKKAAQRLAAEARLNPEAVAAADRLGIDLPEDVLADHTAVQEAVGLTRSLAGSEASAEWRDTVLNAVNRADEIMEEIDGSPDLSSVSERTFRSLQGNIDDLGAEADRLYSAVDNAVPKKSVFQPDNVVKVLNQEIIDLGGAGALSGATKRLFDMVTDPDQPVTYGRLMTEKRLIGKALGNQTSPYGDADTALLNKLYGALSEDQLANVSRIGGEDLRQNLDLANSIYAKKKALESTVTGAFGKDLEGSIASRLRTAITQGSKGDISALNRVMKAIPEDLRGEAVASAISSLARSRTGGMGAENQPFGFAEYSKMYRGLRQNSEVYKTIAKELGPERTKVMQDLYEVSRRITDARSNVLTTGKANQAIVQSMLAEGIVAKVLNAAPSRAARTAAGASIGAAGGGPLGAAVGGALGGGNIGKNRIEAASSLFRSPQFQKMMKEAAETGQVTEASAKKFSKSAPYRSWAKVNNIPDPQGWILAAVASQQVTNEDTQ